ncbi:MAG: hypothetical protein P8J92_03475 [Bacteroidia bacterium]|nr:hypothetical protein [Bacteroidia bacterium]
MKKIFASLVIVFLLVQITQAQVITCVPCDQLGMSVNVGSRESSISIYHSGQYMTHPRSENNFNWEFSDQQGNILNQLNIVDDAFANFDIDWSITDTINVKVHLVNDSANLDNWYISQGLPLTGASINCLFEDQLYWKIDTYPTGTPYGSWTFIHNNTGVDYNETAGIEELKRSVIMDNKIYDIFGRELKEVPIGQIYIRNRKKFIKLN